MPRYADGPSDLPDRETILSMSGLDYVRAMRDGHNPEPTLGRVLGYRLDTVEEGRVTFRGTPEFAHTNSFGGVHGGWYGAILDSAMGCAVMTGVPQGKRWTTLEFKVNITRALPLGMEVICTGELDHAGRSTAVSHGWVRGAEDGRLYATGSTTCILL